jgi:transketolase
MRAYEQIRMDIAYHDLNIKLVGAGGGFTYGLEGFSHFGIEDLSLMRSMPNMNVVVPADPEEAGQFAKISYSFPHPLYIRLGRTGDPAVHVSVPKIKIGKGIILEKGKDVAVFAIGSIMTQAREAIELLRSKGITCTLIDMHTLTPLDKDLIMDCSLKHDAIFTIEEHSVLGGLGSAVAEVLIENNYRGIFERIGIPEQLKKIIGHGEFLRESYGLSCRGIYSRIIKKLTRR